MEAAIVTQHKSFTLYGFSKLHDRGKEYSKTIFELLDEVWKEVRSKQLAHTGINYVVYDADHVVFAGVALQSDDEPASILQRRDLVFRKYAYGKHIGPYHEMKNTYDRIHSAIQASGEQQAAPSMEIYGHWNEDPSKLETEILINLK